MRQMILLATRLQHIEDRIQDFAHVRRAWPTSTFRSRNERGQDGPFFVGQVTGVWFSVHASSLARLRYFSNGL